MSDDQVVARRPQADRFRDLLAAAIAGKIAAEPALLDRAREVMDGGVWSSDYESQWRALVAAGPAAVIGVLTSPHPDTLALKADSPFTMLGLVDDDERQRLLDLVSTRSLTRSGQPREFETRLLHLLERDATVRRCIERATRQTAEVVVAQLRDLPDREITDAVRRVCFDVSDAACLLVDISQRPVAGWERCRVCDQVDAHEPGCPVALIEQLGQGEWERWELDDE